MRKMKEWFWRRFLPEWARDQLLRENAALRSQLERKDREIERLEAYIQGMQAGVRARNRLAARSWEVEE
ncbi:hypothetical protein B5G38_05825 [Gemmiger sp. An87]|uniref:Uncharacterized protein n=2 Tax=Allofournierella massiliensis TaxID=1650663 RepID=A0ABT7URB9_9FIRM|nr:hypothetical protein [Fournierella sp.]MDM8200795.1 hypothetical protein [Fournierella massiliensis]OUN16476.1 hypothetical protein B5G38_05825 [Gemmiger sp. An87]